MKMDGTDIKMVMKKGFLTLFTTLIILSNIVLAKTDYQTDIVDLSAIPVASEVKSNRYNAIINNQTNFWIENVGSTVLFSCNSKLFETNLSSTDVTISFKATYVLLVAGKASANIVENVNLKLIYQNKKLTGKVYWQKKNAISVLITDIKLVGNISDFKELKFENTITTQSFDLEMQAPTKTTFLAPAQTPDNNLVISWLPVTGVESYELEWTYVSDQGVKKDDRIIPALLPIDSKIFENNSSRVELSNEIYSFNIPLVYEKGIILYRLRGVGKGIHNNKVFVIKTLWTVDENRKGTKISRATDYNHFVFNGLENNLNWQSSISFAEEGKTKMVVNYFDGSMRSRQVKTRINSDERAIIGETFYDYNGRPAIQLLPVPVTDNKITYVPNFNLIEGKTLVSKSDYIMEYEGQTCALSSPKFDVATGASGYYSSQNQFNADGNPLDKNTGGNMINRDLLPNAGGYPYTQTRYTPDNTGRVEKQSGVGPDHTLTGNHATTNLYGNPDDKELTRLLGSDVGDKSHYQKNVVIDPNGQASASYLDLDGKVVATALAGTNTTALESLPDPDNKKQRTITAEKLKDDQSNEISYKDNNITYNSKIVVPSATDYTFSYTAFAKPFQISCSGVGKTFVYDAPVKVNFKVYDNCGIIKLDESALTNITLKSSSIQSLNISNKLAALTKGEWNLQKTYTVDKNTINDYWEEYLLEKPSCLKTLEAFKAEVALAVEEGECNLNCAECEAKINSLAAPLVGEERELYESICDRICGRKVACQEELDQMALNLLPDGQYGEIRKSASILKDAAFNNSRPNVLTGSVTTVSTNTQNAINSILEVDGKGNLIPKKNINDVKPEQFPLSVFNDSEGATENVLINHIENTLWSDKPNWRYPLVPDLGNNVPVTKKSLINFYRNLPADLNINFLPKQNAQYLNVDGTVATLSVQIDVITNGQNTTYTTVPEIYMNRYLNENSEVKIIESGTYLVPVKYFKNFKDVEPIWQAHWSYFLMPYHPEIQYYIYCKKESASFEFDQKMLAINKLSELGGVSATNYVLNNDPFVMNASTHPDLFKRALATVLKFQLEQVYDIKLPVSNRATLEKTVSQQMCIAKDDKCVVETCTDVVDNDIEWATFKALYRSTKLKYFKLLATQFTVPRNSYNGCIGNKYYLFVNEPEPNYFKIPRPTVVNEPNLVLCLDNPIENFAQCKQINGYTKKVRNIPPYLSPDQVCYMGTSNLYANKNPIFFPCLPPSFGAASLSKTVSTLIDLNSSSTDLTQTILNYDYSPNIDALNETGQMIIKDKFRQKYELCGQCPLAADIEDFLVNLQQSIATPSSPLGNLTANIPLLCPFNTGAVKMGGELTKLIDPSGLLELSWIGDNTINTSRSITGYIKPINVIATPGLANSATPLATITLEIPAGQYTLTTMSEMVGICCLITDPANNNLFKVKARFKKDNAIYEIMLNGSISLQNNTPIALNTCEIIPLCTITDLAKNMKQFMDVLVSSTNNTDAPNKLNHLLATNVILLDGNNSQTENSPIYGNVIYNLSGLNQFVNNELIMSYDNFLANYTAKWNWSAATNEGVLQIIKLADNSILKSWTISFPSFTGNLAHIAQFAMIRAIQASACTGVCSNDEVAADVLIKSGTAPLTSLPIVIKVNGEPLTVCREAKPPVR